MGRALGCNADRFRAGEGARNPFSLILAAADYAERKTKEAPRELEIWFDWSAYGIPYLPGGQADQPYGLMRRIRAARNVYEAIRAWRQSKDWIAMQAEQPDTWSIIEWVTQLRMSNNG